MLDYKLLQALACVVEEQGFDRAAGKLFISQSAVSQRIKLLEDQMGRVLITRTVPPKPTSEGKRLLKHFMQVKMLEHDLEAETGWNSRAGVRVFSVGINADSLATWFLPAVQPFLESHDFVLDIRVDDQDETHKMLRNGEVSACISSRSSPVQGCRSVYIGAMIYIAVATEEFILRYFGQGLTETGIKKAPAVVFNKKDELHDIFLRRVFGRSFPEIPVHYVPSSQCFVNMIKGGAGYGLVPEIQAAEHICTGRLREIVPDVRIKVELYWHQWNLKSQFLDSFSQILLKNAPGFMEITRL